jgi:5-methylcytosine-specific restriction endonuclease McrA
MWTLEEKRKYHRDWARRHRQTPEYKAYSEEYHNRPEVKAKKLAQWRGWYERHPERKREWCKEWAKNNPLKIKFSTHKQYVKRHSIYKIGNADISKLFDGWDGLCGLCKRPVEGDYHIDHIIPLSRGGLHNQNNLQITHPRCNCRKNNRLENECLFSW